MPIRSMRKIVPSGGKRGASSASRTGVRGCSRPVPSVIRLAGDRRASSTDPGREPLGEGKPAAVPMEPVLGTPRREAFHLPEEFGNVVEIDLGSEDGVAASR